MSQLRLGLIGGFFGRGVRTSISPLMAVYGDLRSDCCGLILVPVSLSANSYRSMFCRDYECVRGVTGDVVGYYVGLEDYVPEDLRGRVFYEVMSSTGAFT